MVETRSQRTTQHAPLERLLTRLRTRKIMPYIMGCHVLDFGCGEHLMTLRSISRWTESCVGFDAHFLGRIANTTDDGILLVGSLNEVPSGKIQRIISLACFEHISEPELRRVFRELAALAAPDCQIVGTVPTPRAKRVLEFLSFKLHLIDQSQIRDHKVYYTREMLSAAALSGGWRLIEYRSFQLGFNSLFRFVLNDHPTHRARNKISSRRPA